MGGASLQRVLFSPPFGLKLNISTEKLTAKPTKSNHRLFRFVSQQFVELGQLTCVKLDSCVTYIPVGSIRYTLAISY